METKLYLRRLGQRLAYLILDVDVEGAEVVALMAIAFWGILLSLPLGTFADFPAYREMASLAPQRLWAAGADALAFWQALALVGHSRRWRRRGLQVAAGWWMGIAVLLFRSAPNGIGWGFCSILCGACAWGYWRIRREERALAAVALAPVQHLSYHGQTVDCPSALKCWQILCMATRLWPGAAGQTPSEEVEQTQTADAKQALPGSANSTNQEEQALEEDMAFLPRDVHG